MWDKYNISHNDLHIGNIMYINTNLKYLDYEINGKKYRVPTNGKIIKIIDFGRACIKLGNTQLNNNVFDIHNLAHTQYYFKNNIFKKNTIVEPNSSNDLVMLVNDILDSIKIEDEKTLLFLTDILRDKQGSFNKMPLSFTSNYKISRVNWKYNMDNIFERFPMDRFKV